MNLKYVSAEPALLFPGSTPLSKPVYLNADRTKFKLLNVPSLVDLRNHIESYIQIRMNALWAEMTEIRDKKLPILFRTNLRNVYKDRVDKLNGYPIPQKKYAKLSQEELQALFEKLQPKNVADMYALYKPYGNNPCWVGYQFFIDTLAASNDAFEFYDAIARTIFQTDEGKYITGKREGSSVYRARSYELLGYSVTKGFLLFPFANNGSGIEEHLILTHRSNITKAVSLPYRPPEADKVFQEIQNLKAARTTEYSHLSHLRTLVLASTFRTVDQSTRQLFEKCIELVSLQKGPMAVQTMAFYRKTYNIFLTLHNARFPGAPPQELLMTERPDPVNLDDWSSFADVSEQYPHLAKWCDWFTLFVKETKDSQGQQRKTSCQEFAAFLVTLANPPLTPLQVKRAHINDFSQGNLACFRGYLASKHVSASAKNGRLYMCAQLFEFIKDRLIASHTGSPKDAPWFAQPIDIKLDRFNDGPLKSGTTRKAIASDVMEEMRKVLTENDYAWSRSQGNYARLHNRNTDSIEYVWCPSATILLYTLLSLPLRSLQGRLCDTGEGDAFIFDFHTCTMVPNPNQLPIDGVLDCNRKEGLLQIIPSGMLDVVDIVGLWITVNKTSGEGYYIPWVSDDLLRHLLYQYEFIRQYTPTPKPQGIIEAQGHRNQPEEWSANQEKFFCLFRDPSVNKAHLDPSLPVSKQKLLKLWASLCLEVETRINARAKHQSQRIKLVNIVDAEHKVVKERTRAVKKNARPFVTKVTAIHDIHTLRVSGITDLLDRGVPLNIVSEYVAGHATYIMTLWYDKPSPGKIRQALKKAEMTAGQSHASIPKFSDVEVQAMTPYLVGSSTLQGGYTGFDAIVENAGLLQFRLAGICPGTRCEEGGLTDKGRIAPVPVGDRGPSCPQCRFFLTGPAFLLGQCIEGNQLILKIRKKVQSLDVQRTSILQAEDSEDFARADVLRAQADLEERQLNDMLAEWWHRMKLYEASVHKLDEYRKYVRVKSSSGEKENSHLILVAENASEDLSYSFKQASNLELEHFLSTCSELLPEYSIESRSTAVDLEMAVGKFLAINSQNDLVGLYFTLTDSQRLTAANLAVEMMLASAKDPAQAAEILEGKTPLMMLPVLEKGIADLVLASGKSKKIIPIREQK